MVVAAEEEEGEAAAEEEEEEAAASAEEGAVVVEVEGPVPAVVEGVEVEEITAGVGLIHHPLMTRWLRSR